MRLQIENGLEEAINLDIARRKEAYVGLCSENDALLVIVELINQSDKTGQRGRFVEVESRDLGKKIKGAEHTSVRTRVWKLLQMAI